MTPQNSIPPSPSASKGASGTSAWKPYEIDPELATSKLISDIISQNGPMGNVSKLFVVWWGIWKGLNHTDEKKTYYDCTLRDEIYSGVFIKTVHINGAQNEKLWQFAMKPKMIVQGVLGQNNFEEEQKPGLISRIVGRFTGGNKNDTAQD